MFVSAATVWEIAIKRRSGKLRLEQAASRLLRTEGFEELDVTVEHAEVAGSLPLHHRDPFDRMLIAQAQREDLTILSRDAAFSLYDVTVFSS